MGEVGNSCDFLSMLKTKAVHSEHTRWFTVCCNGCEYDSHDKEEKEATNDRYEQRKVFPANASIKEDTMMVQTEYADVALIAMSNFANDLSIEVS